ncbi:MAG TPA: hypothetical protein VGX25_22595 [Actinophytocola sp.]|uniref:hypothetical protein n=1 Tax=Actinophytocola sp. TaxID=1872138 RepID=UPI002DDDAD2A|nr:hypothetical protein [Actinophytocola sp.]HEV2782190.1 hypothetical protein [Actinophytocola sp.]
MSRWREYSREQVDALASSAPPITDPAERTCPACGATAVRKYIYEGSRLGRPISFSYVWCGNCHRYSSSTGIGISDHYDFDDPADASPTLRSLRDDNLFGLLDHLDAMWGSPGLPQWFRVRKG